MTSNVKRYDVIIIGGGSAGVSAAFSARAAGATVCLIESEKLGGECPHWACVPTKALLAAAKLYDTMRRHGARFGVRAKALTFDISAVMARKDAVVRVITGNGKRLAQALDEAGVDVVHGCRASFASKTLIKVAERKLMGKAFVIATGSRDYVPAIDGIEDVPVLSFRDVVSLKKLPRSIAIIGAGPVGCEFATFFAMCGVDVTLLQAASQILPREDEELAAMASRALAEKGAAIITRAKTLSVRRHRRETVVTYQQGSERRKTLSVEAVMLASGRRANIDGLQLEKAGVALKDGRVVVDRMLRLGGSTKVFAAGDVTGEFQFTHVAHHAGVTAGVNAAKAAKRGSVRRFALDVVPHVTFIDPEFAGVGMTASEAAKAGKDFAIKRFPIGALGRAVVDGKREGMLKVVVDVPSGMVLGASMLGERAGEVIHELALAMHADIRFDDVQSMIHAYPTYSEAISAAM